MRITGIGGYLVKLGDPPIVIAGSMGRCSYDVLTIRRPIIFIHVKVGGRDEPHIFCAYIYGDKALFVDMLLDNPGIGRPWLQWPECSGCTGSEQKCHNF